MPRTKTPTALKKLADNPGKRALPDSEPVFIDDGTPPPIYLTEKGIELWEKYTAALEANGMLNITNRDFLAAYCDLVAAYITERENNEPPCLKKLQQMRLMAREFGFTPSSQASVSAPSKPEENGKSRFFH